MAVAARATVLRVITMKDKAAMDVPCVRVSAARTIIIKGRKAISLAKADTSLARDITAKAAISLAKVDTNSAKAATSSVMVATSLVRVTTAKAATSSPVKVAISLVRATMAKGTLPEGELRAAFVLAPPAIILMPSTA